MTDTSSTVHADPPLSAHLWAFALRCYSVEKETLLALQETADVHVNDALFLAFAVSESTIPDPARWRQVRVGRPRQLLLRLRRYRQQMQRSHPGRSAALDWELALEQWDLGRLALCLDTKAGDGFEYLDEVASAAAALLGEQSALRYVESRDLIDRLVRSGQAG